MFNPSIPWWQFPVRGLIVYAALVLGLRLAGKRELGQMTPFDLVVILLIANAVQNAMVGPDTSVSGGLVAVGTLLAVNFAWSRLSTAVPGLRRLAQGEPVLLMADGRLLADHMRRAGIDSRELEQAAREHGVPGLGEVRQAVLEVNGSISIIPSTATVHQTEPRHRQQRAHG
jgi:uncharacterized membrane protein YcaP (DUF421 family)